MLPLTFNVIDSTLFLNNASTTSDALCITPKSNIYTYNNQRYRGSLHVLCEHASVELVHGQIIEQEKKEEPPQEIPKVKNSYQVRVLLDEIDFSFLNPVQWIIAGKSGFFIKNERGKILKKIDDDELVISSYYGSIYLNNERFNEPKLFIIPREGSLTFEDNSYNGYFVLVSDNNHAALINTLDLEEYVFSVLRTESWPGWPLEVNKVFAVACRSYAIAMIMRAKTQNLDYHIKNTNAHQTYTGIHESPVLKKAVQETEGIFLAHKGKPIIAMFDACCGGIIPAHMRGFNFAQAPYLKRTYPCTYCKSCKIYQWSVNYPSSSLLAHLNAGGRKVKDIKVTNKDKAGLVHEVSIKTGRGYINVSGKKMYSLVKGIKSFCFTAQKKGENIIFKGRGYGHHLGLCQWGAREMVRKGKSYRDVLQFYYPGTQFMQLA